MFTIALVIISVILCLVIGAGWYYAKKPKKITTRVNPLSVQPKLDPQKAKIPVKPFTNSTPGPIEHKPEVYVYEVDEKKERAIAAMKSIIELSVKDYDGVVSRFIDNAEKIKSPKVLFQKLSATAYDPSEYAKIISNDPVMATRLLRTVNSSAFGLTNPISDVKRAIVYLGANTVKNMTMLISAEGMFSSEDPDVNEAYKKFWLSAFVASMLALKGAQQYNFENPSLLSTTALLSFMGNIAYLNQYPEIAKQYVQCQNLFDRLKIETKLNQVHAAAIAGELTKHWKLPEGISEHIKTCYDLSINAPQAHSESYREAVLLYTCCRMGELIAFRELESFDEFKFSELDDLDLYYIEPHLNAAKIPNFYHFLNTKAIHSELRTIQNLLSK